MALIRPIPVTTVSAQNAGIYHADATNGQITKSALSATTVPTTSYGNIIIFDRSGSVTRSAQTIYHIIHSDGTFVSVTTLSANVVAGDIVVGNVGFTITLD